MSDLFGTDGVRGVANTELTCDIAYKLGQAAVAYLGNTIVIGKDTRISGDMLESALAAGIMSMGGTALLAGIIPTPAIALLTRELHADGGVVISASHNPPEYNGIKFFDNQGFKLNDDTESLLEEYVLQGGASLDALCPGDMVGVILPVDNAADMYVDFVVESISSQGIDFSGMSIALDVGHGASAYTSAEALTRLGAQVTVINDDFTGTDINVECGSTHLEPLKDLVKSIGADVGIAHDGDADRVMLVNPEGDEIDGDIIEAVCALDLRERGKLNGNTVVSTVMCNFGFVSAMREAGIEVLQTKVGDRYVLEAMQEQDLVIGGEQSGHVILLEHNSTGDGLLVAAHFLAACIRSGNGIALASEVMVRYPQSLINVANVDKEAVDQNEAVAARIASAESELGDGGRVLVRPSGTEPLVRVMVEALDEGLAKRLAEEIAEVIKAQLSLPA
ncbi:MAG: phosphoglucosamine mutase [Raoultibacter sp.]|jgi:phosphoglucosamine mutase